MWLFLMLFSFEWKAFISCGAWKVSETESVLVPVFFPEDNLKALWRCRTYICSSCTSLSHQGQKNCVQDCIANFKKGCHCQVCTHCLNTLLETGSVGE